MLDAGGRCRVIRQAAAALGATVLATVIFVTLSPIALRPTIGGGADFERAAAFALLTCSFVTSFPERWRAVLLAALLLAGVLEIAQNLRLDRHGEVSDFAWKASGCVAGTLLALALRRLLWLRSTAL